MGNNLGTTVIKAGTIIDGTGNKPFKNAAVIVEGSVIKSVERQNLDSQPLFLAPFYPDGLPI